MGYDALKSKPSDLFGLALRHAFARASPGDQLVAGDRVKLLIGHRVPEGAASARPLSSRTIEGACIQTFRYPMLGKAPRGFCGGLVLGDSDEDRRLRHTRRRVPFDWFDPEAVDEETLSGHYAYGGMTHRHFGHFMAEMVHRILPSLFYDRTQTFVFTAMKGEHKAAFAQLPGHVRDVYVFLGLKPENIRIVTENTLVESLFVSEAGSDLGGGPKEPYLDLLDAYTEQALHKLFGSAPSHKRLYVSRSKLGMRRGGLCGERYLEAALESEGYEIFHPQDHSVAVQMDQYRKADVVVFLEGSACHGAELYGRNAMKNCVLLARRGVAVQFERVLKPRSKNYANFQSSVYLGTAYARPDGIEARNLGISVLDWDLLTELFRNFGAARLPDCLKHDYLTAASKDLSVYLESASAGRGIAKDPTVAKGVAEEFEAAIARM